MKTKSTTPEDIAFRKSAEKWLQTEGRSDLRHKMLLDLKIDIGKSGCNSWHGLRSLTYAFNYAEGDGEPGLLHRGEQVFLMGELAEFVTRVSPESGPLNLKMVSELFQFDGCVDESTEFGNVLEPLLELQPDLNLRTGPRWVIGWQRLSN